MNAGMTPRVTATIDLAAIRHNLARVRACAPGARVMAAIKADGYGHGAVAVAGALADADALAVACVEEALQLRSAGIDRPIVLLEGVLSTEEAGLCARHGLGVVVHDRQQLTWLAALPESAAVRCWIKLDTGMNRLGFPSTAAADTLQALQALPGTRFGGWMTHLACADEAESPMTALQIECFAAAVRGLPGERSLANSAGILGHPDSHADWVRPGLMLYGASPFPGRDGREHGLRPAMQLRSRILSIHAVRAGETVGYGARWHCPRDTRLGVVSIGYADGLHRALPTSGVQFGLRGGQAELVGRVSMDMISIDLSRVPEARIGDPVTLWGDSPRVETIAGQAGTLAYELLCGLTNRVRFEYVDSDRGDDAAP